MKHHHSTCTIIFLFFITPICCENEQHLRSGAIFPPEDSFESKFKIKEQDEIIHQPLHDKLEERSNDPLQFIQQYPPELKFQLDLQSNETFVKNSTRTLQSNHLDEPIIPQIIGGTVVRTKERYPYMASILDSRRLMNQNVRVWHVCGGSLIKPNIVLGAAHCAGAVADYIQLGKRHISGGTTLEEFMEVETYQITEQVYHPDWDRRLFYRDLVLYKMDSSSSKLPVRIARDVRDSVLDQYGKRNQILGWGRTENNGRPSTYLREATVKHIPHRECVSNKYYYGDIIDEDAMMCFADRGKDSCQGDSGGPLVQIDDFNDDPENDLLLGVISWGVDCAQERYPGVYAKLDYDWIETAVCDSENGLAPESCFNGKLYETITIEEGDEEEEENSVTTPSTKEPQMLDLCVDSEDYVFFQDKWDKYSWNCPKVKRWWWYACLYYSAHCPESCCGEGNCDPETGICSTGFYT